MDIEPTDEEKQAIAETRVRIVKIAHLSCKLRRAEELLTAQAAQIAVLREAGNELVTAIDLCLPAIENAFAMQGLRGLAYNGPTFGFELASFRQALAGRKDQANG